MMKHRFYIILLCLLSLSFYCFPLNAQSGTSLQDEQIKSKRPKVGLVLSGGGAKGFAYIGLFRVLEEVGLTVDYVGGTSIGSIMAGFYALGYSADEIENIVRTQNWDKVLRDEIDRKYVAYEEKSLWEKSIVSLPLKKRKIGINSSLYYGQQVNLLLNKYFSPGWSITDFNKLPTPFLCIGTDLFTGESVVLNKGYLAMAVRSSMSIPGYFSPTFFQGRYLVDGGVVNNYPAREVQQMGAQFIIGGDVQSGLKSNIDELTTVTGVINQIVSFNRTVANQEAFKLIDLNIKYPVREGMMDFMKYDSIIAEGERVARLHYPQLKALADSLNSLEFKPLRKLDTKPLECIQIDQVKYDGNVKMSSIYLDNYFEEFEGESVSFQEIEEKITFVYGTGFFKYVFYELEPADNGHANLIVKVKESAPGYVSAAIHYDVDYSGSILLGGVFRNILGNRSKLFTEVILGPNPRFKVFYTVSNGSKPSFGVELDMYNFEFKLYQYNRRSNLINFSTINLSVFLTQSRGNVMNWRLGLQGEYFRLKEQFQVAADTIGGSFNPYANAFISMDADTRDTPYFSKHGFLLSAKALYVVPLSNSLADELFTNSLVFYTNYEQNIYLSQKMTLKTGLYAGGTLRQDAPPLQHWFGVGGLNEINYIGNLVPFSGLNFVQRVGNYVGIARLKLQYNIFEKFYFTLRTDVGNNEVDVDEAFDVQNLMAGYGGTISYNSFIGPVELSLLGSNLNAGLMVFFNLGFAF
ncbi:MAG: patatin-like phospholipase family protein [Bacteroidetes bacterium]|nr:patatin-like phospholipase family protein [Bacteroidota bacterium]